jgi:hypothetical protein
VKEALAYHQDYLAKIDRGDVTSFTRLVRTKRGFESREYSVREMGAPLFEVELQALRQDVVREIGDARADIAYMTARIDAWKPMPSRTVDEHEQERRTTEERVARSQLRQDKAAERLARAREAESKRETLRVQRAAEGAEILRQLREMAARSDHESEAVRSQAGRLAKKLRTPKYQWFWGTNIDRDPAFDASLLRLGLAEMRDYASRGAGGTGMYVHYLF